MQTLRQIKESIEANDRRRKRRGHDGLDERDLRAISESRERRHRLALYMYENDGKLPPAPFRLRQRSEGQ